MKCYWALLPTYTTVTNRFVNYCSTLYQMYFKWSDATQHLCYYNHSVDTVHVSLFSKCLLCLSHKSNERGLHLLHTVSHNTVKCTVLLKKPKNNNNNRQIHVLDWVSLQRKTVNPHIALPSCTVSYNKQFTNAMGKSNMYAETWVTDLIGYRPEKEICTLIAAF